jgi:regulator of replication initiation timing
MKKLKNILQEVFEESPQVDKYKVVEGVKNFGIVGKQLYNNNNIVETAKQLAEIAESAHHHILGENDDWFDKVSVNKNMKTLKGSVVEFTKTAKEAQAVNQRLTALYEDMGHILNRYYDISEDLDPVDTSKVEPEDDFKDREDKDIDNDGDVDGSDEYLHKKRQAISKAVKKESKGIGGVVGIPALGDMIRRK